MTSPTGNPSVNSNPKTFTDKQIAEMSAEDYEVNRDAIFKQLAQRKK